MLEHGTRSSASDSTLNESLGARSAISSSSDTSLRKASNHTTHTLDITGPPGLIRTVAFEVNHGDKTPSRSPGRHRYSKSVAISRGEPKSSGSDAKPSFVTRSASQMAFGQSPEPAPPLTCRISETLAAAALDEQGNVPYATPTAPARDLPTRYPRFIPSYVPTYEEEDEEEPKEPAKAAKQPPPPSPKPQPSFPAVPIWPPALEWLRRRTQELVLDMAANGLHMDLNNCAGGDGKKDQETATSEETITAEEEAILTPEERELWISEVMKESTNATNPIVTQCVERLGLSSNSASQLCNDNDDSLSSCSSSYSSNSSISNDNQFEPHASTDQTDGVCAEKLCCPLAFSGSAPRATESLHFPVRADVGDKWMQNWTFSTPVHDVEIGNRLRFAKSDPRSSCGNIEVLVDPETQKCLRAHPNTPFVTVVRYMPHGMRRQVEEPMVTSDDFQDCRNDQTVSPSSVVILDDDLLTSLTSKKKEEGPQEPDPYFPAASRSRLRSLYPPGVALPAKPLPNDPRLGALPTHRHGSYHKH